MPRRPRHWIPGLGAHSISRFVDRKKYVACDADRAAFVDAITKAHGMWDWIWLSYAFMSTHVHYGLIAGLLSPSQFFSSTHTRYAAHHHRSKGGATVGPVFASRPTIWAIEGQKLARLVAYHHRNPVEAGVVKLASESRWTSHRSYLRLDPAPPWLDVEQALDAIGFRDTAAGRRRFDEFVMTIDFRDREFDRSPRNFDRGDLTCGPTTGSVDWDFIIATARTLSNVPAHVPINSRRRSAARARALVATVATAHLGAPLSLVAEKLGIAGSTACNLVRRGDERPEVVREVARLRALLDETKI